MGDEKEWRRREKRSDGDEGRRQEKETRDERRGERLIDLKPW